MCDHKQGIGRPEFVSGSSTSCDFLFYWKTSLACPPFDEVECMVADKKGNVYDLSSLSLPNQNYDIRPNQGTRYALNVCRSHVHNSLVSECPNKAAVCWGKLSGMDNGTHVHMKWRYFDVGQVTLGPKLDKENDGLILEYRWETNVAQV